MSVVARVSRTRVAAVAIAVSAVMAVTTGGCGSSQTLASGSDPPVPAATAAAVHCAAPLSCDVVLDRGRTRFLATWLGGGSVSSAVVSGAASEAGCLLLTRELLTHVTCAVLTYIVIHRIAKALRKAASAGGCLRMGFEAPNAHRSWRPVYADTDATARCHH